MTISFLQITDLLKIRHFSAVRLATLLQAHFNIKGVLLSGISRTGSKIELNLAREQLMKLCDLLNLEPERFLIAPSIEDQRLSYGHFSNFLFEPLLGSPYRPDHFQSLSIQNELQILTLNTVFLTDPLGPNENHLQEVLAAIGDTHSFKGLFGYFPVEIWQLDGKAPRKMIDDAIAASKLSTMITSAPQSVLHLSDPIPSMGTDGIQIYNYKPETNLLTLIPVDFTEDECFVCDSSTHIFR